MDHTMNEQSFNNELKKIAPDMKLLFDPEAKLWGVYQTRQPIKGFLMPDSVRREYEGSLRPMLMWYCKDETGGFRLPDQSDLAQAVRSAYSGHVLWEKGGNAYTDKIESQEKAREEKKQAEQDDLFRQAAKDIARSSRGKTTNMGTRR